MDGWSDALPMLHILTNALALLHAMPDAWVTFSSEANIVQLPCGNIASRNTGERGSDM